MPEMPDNVLVKVQVKYAVFTMRWLRNSGLHGEAKYDPR